MTIEAAVISFLLAVDDLEDLVEDRIKPLKLDPNSEIPAIVIYPISSPPILRMEGASKEFRTRLQFDIWAKTLSDAKAVSSEVRLALDGYKGTMGSVRVDSVVFLDESGDLDPENDNVRIIQEYEFYHGE